MPNLKSIVFNIYPTGRTQFRRAPWICTDTLDSVTTVEIKYDFTESIEQWLIYILPNLKSCISSCKNLFFIGINEKIEKLSISDVDLHYLSIIKDYFSNLQDVEINLLVDGSGSRSCLMQFLHSFRQSKILTIQFYSVYKDYPMVPIADLSEIFAILDMEEIQRNYQIKHAYNYLQLIKINQ
jgi:hypothetical protein